MSFSAFQVLSDLDGTRRALDDWACTYMTIDVRTSFLEYRLREINFSDTIGHKKRVPKPLNRNEVTCYWLNAEWRNASAQVRQNEIIPYFIRRAGLSGFKICGAWEERQNCIVFTCYRGHYNDHAKNLRDSIKRRPTKKLKNPNSLPKKINKKTQRPPKITQEEREDPQMQEDLHITDVPTCKYSFRVFWDWERSSWFVPKKQSGNCVHSGHPVIEHPLIRYQTHHAVSAHEVGVARSSVNSDISANQTCALVKTRTGTSFDWQQMHYLKRKDQEQLLASDHHNTSADKLAYQLSLPGVSSLSLYADYTTDCLCIKQKKRSSNSTSVEETMFNDNLGDTDDSPEDFARTMQSNIRDKLKLTLTGQILLIAVWTTDVARRKYDMFPKFGSADDTEGINSEERPLHTWTGKDSNNELFPYTWMFMCSRSLWVFNFGVSAHKHLHPGTAVNRVIKVVIDQHQQETMALAKAVGRSDQKYALASNLSQEAEDLELPNFRISNASGNPILSLISPRQTSVFPNAQMGHCGFHKVNRGFTHNVKYKSMLDAEKDKSILCRIDIDVIVQWMWFFIKHYKNLSEIEFSSRLFCVYMTEPDQSGHIGSLSQNIRTMIMDFMCRSFFPHSDTLFEASFRGMTMAECTSSINESYHRAVKRIEGGPRPNHDLGEAAKRINKRARVMEISKSKRAAYDSTSVPAKMQDRKLHSSKLSGFCNEKLVVKQKMSKKIHIFRQSNNCFYAKRDYSVFPTTVDEDLGKAYNFCESMLDTMVSHLEDATDPVEKNCILHLKEKLLGMKKGNLPQYRVLANKAVKFIVPCPERTHVVNIVTVNGEKYMRCGGEPNSDLPCDFEQHGRACEHMYRLLDRQISSRDAHIRWHQDYNLFYGRHQGMTDHFIKIRDEVNPLGLILTDKEVRHIESLLKVGTGTKPCEFFTCSLGKVRLSGTGTYWHRIRHRLPIDLQECIPIDDSADEQSIDKEMGNADTADGVFMGVDISPDPDSMSKSTGPTQLIAQGSSYMVPSQLTQEESDINTDGISTVATGCSTVAVGSRSTKTSSGSSTMAVGSRTMKRSSGSGTKTVPSRTMKRPVAQHAFLPMYETACKLASAAGAEGRRVMHQQLNKMRDQQLEIIARKQTSNAGKGKDNVYGEFMHLFQTICAHTDEAGEEGRSMLKEGMNVLKTKENEILSSSKGSVNDGMASMHSTCIKTKDSRIQSKCSPVKYKQRK